MNFQNLCKASCGLSLLGLVAWLPTTNVLSPSAREVHAAAPFKTVADRKEKDDRVEELMERVHEGKKSPLARTKAALASNTPDWNDLVRQAGAFTNMSAALKASKDTEVRDSADSYSDAATDLAAAVKLRDVVKARAALKSLTASCTDCHYKGGPGGKLDDD